MDLKKVTVYGLMYLATLGIIGSAFLMVPLTGMDLPYFRAVVIFFATVLLTKYFLFMVLAPWHEVLRARTTHKKQHPWVSVLIPAYNEGRGVIETVKTILASDYKRLEVIVVNDGSKDNSDALMRELVATHVQQDIVLRYFYKENGGKAKALNFALEKAVGDIIITIDADCALLPTSVGEFVRVFDNPKTMAAVGNVRVGNTSTLVGVVQSLEFLFSFYFKKAEAVMGSIYILGGAAAAFRREVFDVVGHFAHDTITEDIELSVRIQKAGFSIDYAANAVVITEGASDINGLCKQRLRWSKGMAETFAKHSDLIFSTDPQHNKVFTWFVLPLTYFGKLQLLLEPWFLIMLYIYAVRSHNFTGFISAMTVVGSIFIVMMVFQGKHNQRKLSFFILAPIGWILFYISTYVEHRALLGTIYCTVTKKEVKWQAWARTGVYDQKVISPILDAKNQAV